LQRSAFGGLAIADDHLFQAEQLGHGLFDNDQSEAIENAEKAPGQGSPFTGLVLTRNMLNTISRSISLIKPVQRKGLRFGNADRRRVEAQVAIALPLSLPLVPESD
jgi:hypothetical protein